MRKALIYKIGTVKYIPKEHSLVQVAGHGIDGWIFRTDDLSQTNLIHCGWDIEELAAIAAVNELFGEDAALKLAKQLARGAK